MAVPSINPLPAAPSRADGPDQFNEKADTFIASLPPFVLQTNALATAINAAVLDIGNSLSTSASSAASALASANAAAAAQAGALSSASQAQAAAVAAGAATGLGALGNPGDAIIVKDGRAGVGYAPVNRVGDILITAGPMAMPWVPANGGIRNSFSYPTLAAALGKLGGQVGQTWSTPAMGFSGVDIASAPSSTAAGPTRLMAISSAGGTRYSADGGNTWANTGTALPGTNSSASNGIFYDEATDTWIALCPTGTTSFMFVSNDNGATWTARTLPAACIKIGTDQNNVWIALPLANGIFAYRSVDLGQTWTQITTGTGTSPQSALATDGKGVWCIATGGGIRRSNDGGLTWTTAYGITCTSISTNKNGVWFAGASATSSTGTTYKSSDNGLNWASQPSPAATSILDIAYSMGFFFFVRSISPQVMTTSDMPDATLYNVPSTAVLTGLSKITAVDGYAVAVSTSQTTALRSAPIFAYDPVIQFQLPDFPVAKGLRAWIKAASGLYSVGQFTNVGLATGSVPVSVAYDGISTAIIAASNLSTLMRSTDKGVTWNSISPLTANMTHVVHLGGQNWFACGALTTGVRSSDNGATWTPVTIVSGSKNSLVAGSNGRIVMGLASGPRISMDYGQTWAAIPIGAITHRYPCTDGGGNWLIASSSMTIAPIVSRDNGTTWQNGVAPSTESSTVFASVMFQDGSVLLSTNSVAGFLYSADWTNWSRRPRPSTITSMVNTGAGIVLGVDSANLQRSVDYGLTWYPAIAYSAPRIAGKIGVDSMLTNGNAVFTSPANTWV